MSGEWSYAHDLVNMYLGIAHLADNELDPEEERTFLVKFREWMPHITIDQFAETWQEVSSLYESLASDENRYALYLQSTLNVARLLEDSKQQLMCIIQDLVDIAGADGVLHDNEMTMIKAAGFAYGLDVDLTVEEDTKRIRLKSEQLRSGARCRRGRGLSHQSLLRLRRPATDPSAGLRGPPGLVDRGQLLGPLPLGCV